MRRPRVLVTCVPQSGHLHPLVPTARALADAGCSVLMATGASHHAALAAAGLEAVDVGPSQAQPIPLEVMSEALSAPPSARRPILFSYIFGRVYAPAVADDLFEQARSWEADVLVAGLESLAGPLVAARLGMPLVVSGFGTGLGKDVCDAAANAVTPLWERAGLAVPRGRPLRRPLRRPVPAEPPPRRRPARTPLSAGAAGAVRRRRRASIAADAPPARLRHVRNEPHVRDAGADGDELRRPSPPRAPAQ